MKKKENGVALRVLTLEEVARDLRVSTFTIRRMIKSKRIGAIPMGRRILVPVDEFERVIRQGIAPRSASK